MLSLCQIIIILKSDLRFVDSHSIRNTKNKPIECLALGRNDAVYIQIPWIPTNSLFHPFIKMYSRRAYPWHTFCTTVSNVFQTKGQLNILAIEWKTWPINVTYHQAYILAIWWFIYRNMVIQRMRWWGGMKWGEGRGKGVGRELLVTIHKNRQKSKPILWNHSNFYV